MIQLAYGLMTAHEAPGVVQQLVGTLGEGSPVIIHHDTRAGDIPVPHRSNLFYVERPASTGWGTAGFCKGVFRLIRTALASSGFDYFQLLSGSCLPIKPLECLHRHLDGGAAVYADFIDIDRDVHALLSHGHRVYARPSTLGGKVLRRVRRWYFEGDTHSYEQESLGMLRAVNDGVAQRVGRTVHQAARLGAFDRMPFTPGFKPFIGSTWMCLRRDACEWLVEQEDSHPGMGYLMSLQQCDEILFPTLLVNRFGDERGPSNHYVNEFVGSHPRIFATEDLDRLSRSERFFARKFSQDPQDEMRLAVVEAIKAPADQFSMPAAGWAPTVPLAPVELTLPDSGLPDQAPPAQHTHP